MALKLSIFTTKTRPKERGDNYIDALESYHALADEVVVIDCEKTWGQEFSFEIIGQHFQRGYEACTGDWVIRADLDYIFHEKDFKTIRQAFADNPNAPAMSFYKYQFVLPDKYNLKSRLVIALNKRVYGDRIKLNGGGDLCQPTLDGKLIEAKDVPEVKVGFYNYEKILKTKAQVADDVGRMERAYKQFFGKTQYGSDGTNEDGYKIWVEAHRNKYNKPSQPLKLEQHPIFIQETIKNLRPEQWGYNGHGFIGGNQYVKGN